MSNIENEHKFLHEEEESQDSSFREQPEASYSEEQNEEDDLLHFSDYDFPLTRETFRLNRTACLEEKRLEREEKKARLEAIRKERKERALREIEAREDKIAYFQVQKRLWYEKHGL